MPARLDTRLVDKGSVKFDLEREFPLAQGRAMICAHPHGRPLPEMNMLKLFYAPGSCARASHIALREAHAEFELQLVDLTSAEQRSPSYRKINPKARVPALQTERGILTETPAILAYIAQRYRGANLAALDDRFEFARLQAFNSYLCSTVHVAHAHSRRGERWADDPAAIAELKRKAPEVMAACFQLIEDAYLAGPWIKS